MVAPLPRAEIDRPAHELFGTPGLDEALQTGSVDRPARRRRRARWPRARRACSRRRCSSTRTACRRPLRSSSRSWLPATPVCCSGPSAPMKRISCCADDVHDRQMHNAAIRQRARTRHPPGRASSVRLALLFETVWAGFHHRLTRVDRRVVHARRVRRNLRHIAHGKPVRRAVDNLRRGWRRRRQDENQDDGLHKGNGATAYRHRPDSSDSSTLDFRLCFDSFAFQYPVYPSVISMYTFSGS